MNEADEKNMMAKVFGERKQPEQPREHVYLAQLIERELRNGPMKVVGYHSLPGHNGKPGSKALGDDAALLEKTRTVRLPHEKYLGQLYQRTGIGKAQLIAWSVKEIERFCEIAEQREREFIPHDPLPMSRQIFVDLSQTLK
jgi:hypothetical protein